MSLSSKHQPLKSVADLLLETANQLEYIATKSAATLRLRDRLLGAEAKNEDPAVLSRGDVPLHASRRAASAVTSLLSVLEAYEHDPPPRKAQEGGDSASVASGASSLHLLGASAAEPRTAPPAAAQPRSVAAILPAPVRAAARRVGDVLRRCARQSVRCSAERALRFGAYRLASDQYRTLLSTGQAGQDASVWVRRGAAFLGMGALCLAEMHADRAVELGGERPEHVEVDAPALEGRVVAAAEGEA